MVAAINQPADGAPGTDLFGGTVFHRRNRIVLLHTPLAGFQGRISAVSKDLLTTEVTAHVTDHVEHLRMVEAVDRRTAAAHRKAGHGPVALLPADAVRFLHIGNQFAEEIVLISPFRHVEIDHVALAGLGTDDHHLFHLAF